jgi:hypothetical protein
MVDAAIVHKYRECGGIMDKKELLEVLEESIGINGPGLYVECLQTGDLRNPSHHCEGG